MTVTISIESRIAAIGATAWDRLANPDGLPFDPFLSFAFLDALEQSGCVGPGTGWTPQHLVLRAASDPGGEPLAVAPVYLKSHSQGEYIFDHAFADAWHRAGGQWYPKLLCAVPFTPVPGRRLLAGNGPHSLAYQQTLAAALAGIASGNRLATAQVNFCDQPLVDSLASTEWMMRQDIQFHFHNRGFADFEAFLASLSSARRKTLRKEREKARAQVEIVRLSGGDLTEEHWDVFFACYMDTGARKWGRPYLNRDFFRLIDERMADKVVLVMARDRKGWCAAALNFAGSEALYGRHWGCLRDYPMLHFELCYYQAIDEALARGLARVEAGAQGGHKLARGYEPSVIHALNWVGDPGLRRAIARYLAEETAALGREAVALQKQAPFRHDDHLLDGHAIDGGDRDAET